MCLSGFGIGDISLRSVTLYKIWKQNLNTVKKAKQYAKTNCFMFIFNLRSCYYNMNISQENQKYRGFSWVNDGDNKYGVF